MKKIPFGSYVVFTEDPGTTSGKAKYVKEAVNRLLDSLTAEIVPDWNTMQLIVKEGPGTWFDISGEDDDEIPPKWIMTVGIKFLSDQYPERITQEGEDA